METPNNSAEFDDFMQSVMQPSRGEMTRGGRGGNSESKQELETRITTVTKKMERRRTMMGEFHAAGEARRATMGDATVKKSLKSAFGEGSPMGAGQGADEGGTPGNGAGLGDTSQPADGGQSDEEETDMRSIIQLVNDCLACVELMEEIMALGLSSEQEKSVLKKTRDKFAIYRNMIGVIVQENTILIDDQLDTVGMAVADAVTSPRGVRLKTMSVLWMISKFQELVAALAHDAKLRGIGGTGHLESVNCDTVKALCGGGDI